MDEYFYTNQKINSQNRELNINQEIVLNSKFNLFK